MPEAIAAYQKAIDLDPKSALPYNGLGTALRAQRKLPEAIAAYHKAIAIDPKLAMPYNGLGNVLLQQKRLPEAIAAYRKAIELDPKSALPYNGLGSALSDQKKLPEAADAYKQSLAINSEDPQVWFNLGLVLAQNDLSAAAVSFKKAIQLNVNFAEAHCILGRILRDQGEFAEALAALQKGHELGSRRPGWNHPSAAWVKDCQQLLALEKRLPEVLRGDSADPAEQLKLADLCLRYKQRYGEAALLYGRALAAEPKLAEDLVKAPRYAAARAAILAASGKGAGADKLEPSDKARLRRQALDWLQADLAAHGKHLEQNPATAAPIQKLLQRWLDEAALVGVRDAKELDALPAAEQLAWRQLWGEVDALRQKASQKR
jgi:tetratricopeptide (TPR) repeat protein